MSAPAGTPAPRPRRCLRPLAPLPPRAPPLPHQPAPRPQCPPPRGQLPARQPRSLGRPLLCPPRPGALGSSRPRPQPHTWPYCSRAPPHPVSTRAPDVCRLSACAGPPSGREGRPWPLRGPLPAELSKRAGMGTSEGRWAAEGAPASEVAPAARSRLAAGRVIHASRCRCCYCRCYCCEVGLSPPPWP